MADRDVPSPNRLSVVMAGHVDHGKSSLLGRLLSETRSLPEGRIDQIRAVCARDGRPFEYAFLADALREERSRGITMDTARAFLRTARRHYIFHDAPGHAELLRNMVTGAARAEAAVLVVDATEGMRDSSRRHARMLAILAVEQLCVAVNKMDLVGYDDARFADVVGECSRDLASLGLHAMAYIPVSAREGDNVVESSARLPWYHGPTLVEALDAFHGARPLVDRPLRMPVQGVYDDPERGAIVAGMIESGMLAVDDDIAALPSGACGRIARLEAFNRPPLEISYSGEAAGFVTAAPFKAARGDVVFRAGDPPPVVASRIDADVFWLGVDPLLVGREYVLKVGTARASARVESLVSVVDADRLAMIDGADRVERNQMAECTLALEPPVACDTADVSPATGRFVLLDDGEIRGGGRIRRAAAANASSSGSAS